MKKEEICIDLSKCTQEERKNIYKTIVEAGEGMLYANKLDKYGNYDISCPYIAFGIKLWHESKHKGNKTSVSYQDFMSVFKPKKNNPFKVGDKVYSAEYGWGEVESVSYVECTVKFNDTTRFVRTQYLSFTEYTMQGFSQERPVDYEQMAKDKVVGWFWDGENNNSAVLGILESYLKENHKYKFNCCGRACYRHFRPLTPEEKEVLEKNELFNEIFKK